MRRYIVKTVLLMGLGASSGCSQGGAQLDALLPAAATSITHTQHSEAGDGVAFNLETPPFSYEYIEGLRSKLRSSGYTLCEKSAIKNWERKPSDAQPHGEEGFWMVDLYEAKHYTSFLIVRVLATPTDRGTWRQHFFLAVQEVPEGRQDMKSIGKFCD
ncbi:hypothetical protein [Luteibacter sp. SG786]|uniref:hypothetical protein n=1 Tax=Luteibacter sp. SG786 TaxID=2587130 RepID=UPI0014249B70|nr:hypothetical protein [Luteibacter sp. SG786]NII53158.1 hypothetical protein [Luteibacter sp. SG786]